ncbi:MAG TPA: cysteine desulfurase family protein [Steroidobacteraceae bacterium]|nr:cysteine desulfurase family protein [Steroidobacteraceae bacterium]
MQPIYLDFNASTPVHPQVEAAMQAAAARHGNPSSSHWAGSEARAALELGRTQVADFLGCTPEEVVFTSGGSEANNLALKGCFHAARGAGPHLVTTAVEHPSVSAPAQFLARQGARVTYLPVDRRGLVDPEALRRALGPHTILVSIMHANNETGAIQPIAACAAIARDHGVAFHTDAAQSVGKIPARVAELGVDLLSVAGHKLYAPKGIGALYVRAGTALEPLVHGAGQQHGRRAGTENAALAAALGAACVLAQAWMASASALRALRDEFWQALRATFGGQVTLNGEPEHCLPNTLNVSFAGRDAQTLVAGLSEQGVAVSAGSACHSGRVEVSAVLRAMGVSESAGRGAIRFSLGRETTAAQLREVITRLARVLKA